jgi:hypothetical protein
MASWRDSEIININIFFDIPYKSLPDIIQLWHSAGGPRKVGNQWSLKCPPGSPNGWRCERDGVEIERGRSSGPHRRQWG